MRKLVCNFDAPDDDVYTLYDNWEKAVARFPHVRSSSVSSCDNVHTSSRVRPRQHITHTHGASQKQLLAGRECWLHAACIMGACLSM